MPIPSPENVHMAYYNKGEVVIVKKGTKDDSTVIDNLGFNAILIDDIKAVDIKNIHLTHIRMDTGDDIEIPLENSMSFDIRIIFQRIGNLLIVSKLSCQDVTIVSVPCCHPYICFENTILQRSVIRNDEELKRTIERVIQIASGIDEHELFKFEYCFGGGSRNPYHSTRQSIKRIYTDFMKNTNYRHTVWYVDGD